MTTHQYPSVSSLSLGFVFDASSTLSFTIVFNLLLLWGALSDIITTFRLMVDVRLRAEAEAIDERSVAGTKAFVQVKSHAAKKAACNQAVCPISRTKAEEKELSRSRGLV